MLPPQARGTAKAYFIFRDLFNRNEIELIRNHICNGGVFIDVGANLGFYTIMGSVFSGEKGLVIAFEPAYETFQYLEKNKSINHLRNVRVFNCGLADREMTSKLWHHPDPSRFSLGATGSDDYEDVRIKTLDQVIIDEGLVRVDVIKIDVEGYEELVLKGAKDTIQSFTPIILFENNPDAIKSSNLTTGGAIELLINLGYSLYRIEESGIYSRNIEKNNFGDYIAIYKK